MSRDLTPPRPILILDETDCIRAGNRAFIDLCHLLRRWGRLTPTWCQDELRGRHVEQILPLPQQLPRLQAGEVDRRSIALRWAGLDCRLGLRGVQWGDEHSSGRALYWRRLSSSSTLIEQILQSGMRISPGLRQYKHSANGLSALLVEQFDQLAILLLEIGQSPLSEDLRSTYEAALAEHFDALCSRLNHVLNSQDTKETQLFTLIDDTAQTLRAIIAALQEIQQHTQSNSDQAQNVSSLAAQGMLVTRLMWIESARCDGDHTVAKLSTDLHQFAQNGLGSAERLLQYSDKLLQQQRRSGERLNSALQALENMESMLHAHQGKQTSY